MTTDNEQPDIGSSTWGQPVPDRRRRVERRWWSMILPLLLVPALVVVFAGGWFYDYKGRVAALEQAHSAFEKSDCPAAMAAYTDAERGRVPWGSPAESPYPAESEKYQCDELTNLAASWDAGQFADAAKGYADFRTDNPGSAALVALWDLVQTSARSQALRDNLPKAGACTAVDSIRRTSSDLKNDFAGSSALDATAVPERKPVADDAKTLVACASTFERTKQTAKAYDFYASAMKLKPAGPVLSKATSGRARTDVQLARAANPGKLPAPERISGSGSGPATVVVRNDSPERLELTMSGRKPVITSVPACRSCHTYAGTGPAACPDSGPRRTFTVPSGTYSVAVRSKVNRSGQEVTPFVGSWNLTRGSRYESCFFIVTSQH